MLWKDGEIDGLELRSTKAQGSQQRLFGADRVGEVWSWVAG